MRQKLNELIANGSDIEFKYRGVWYTILSWTEDGIVIGAQDADDDATFRDASALFSGYMIGDRLFCDIVDEIELGFSS